MPWERASEDGLRITAFPMTASIGMEAAIEEGVQLETLVSPINVEVQDGRMMALQLLRNELGPLDASWADVPAGTGLSPALPVPVPAAGAVTLAVLAATTVGRYKEEVLQRSSIYKSVDGGNTDNTDAYRDHDAAGACHASADFPDGGADHR